VGLALKLSASFSEQDLRLDGADLVQQLHFDVRHLLNSHPLAHYDLL
jgi:hypothetical protein